MKSLQQFPMERRCPCHPPPEYAEMRETAAVVRVAFRDGPPVWVVTRHAEARQALTHPGVSTDPNQKGHPFATAAGSLQGKQPGDFIDMDPPEHDRYRRMLIPEFSVRRIRELRPDIQRVADLLIDDMLDGDGADLVEAFGFPLATLVICRLLGVPYEEREYFYSRTRKMVTGLSSPEEAGVAVNEVRAYVDGLVTRSEAAPGDDLIGRLVTRRLAVGELSHDELVGMVFLLLVAGHQTVANMIPLSAFTLLRHPAQLAELRGEPSLWPMAVEELLRYHSVVDWVAFDRVALKDLEIGGRRIRAGEGVFVLGASANRDDRVFALPDTFDVHREAGNHLAFGYGVHQCLGQNLARAELEIALRTLFERIPGLRVAEDVERLPFKFGAGTFGVHRLTVGW